VLEPLLARRVPLRVHENGSAKCRARVHDSGKVPIPITIQPEAIAARHA